MNNNMLSLVDHALPELEGKSVIYNAEKKIYLTTGYTSAAGNTYYEEFRMSDRVLLKLNIGQGYAFTFLNGVSLYVYDGKTLKLAFYHGMHNVCYSEHNVEQTSIELIQNYLKSQALMMGYNYDEEDTKILAH